MEVSFIGSGNLAWHLAIALDNTDYAVREVYSRHHENSSALVARLYEAKVNTSLDFSESRCRIFIMAVADDVIPDIAGKILLPPGAILIHTSGSRPLDVLAETSASKIGVFYPLQTFSKNKKVDFGEIPIFVESDDKDTEKLLLTMAKAISRKVFHISSDQRKLLHLSAIFASNFTNHMLTIARDIVSARGLDYDWLKPLIAETINKSLTIGPEAAQTGPARRGDLEILDAHMELLQDDESLAEIYRVISQHIVDRYEA